MRVRDVAAALAATAVLLLAGAPAAHAADPVDLGGAYVLDDSHVLGSGGAARVKAALDDLYAKTGQQLFVVLVPSFEGTAGDQAWADRTAELSGLGDKDALLAIATDDRVFRTSVAQSFPLSDAQLSDIAEKDLVPHLRSNDWTGGLVAYADGMRDALTPGFPVAPVAILGGLVVAGAGLGVGIGVARRRRRVHAERLDRMNQEQLDQRAGTLLVQLDDALKTSEQEVGFAQAQFGDDAVAQFSTVLDDARAKAKEAFRLQQQLDDSTPETPEQKRTMTLQIIQLCTDAAAELDAQADDFEKLRQLEQNAPLVLQQLTTAHAGAKARIEAASATLARLAATYGAAGVASAAGTVEQATKLDALVTATIEQAGKDLAAGKGGQAAMAVRGAQQASDQIDQLLAGIDKLAADLAALGGQLQAAVDDTRADIAEARTIPATPGSTATADAATISTAVAQAEQVLKAVAGQDPTTAKAAVDRANAAVNQAMAHVRDRQTQVARAQQSLGQAIATGSQAIARANGYITTRRGGVGTTSRTRLSEAQRHLDQANALSASDPVMALGEAQQAASMANEGLNLAMNDVEGASWGSGSILGGGDDPGSFGAGSGGALGGGGDGSFGSAVLGGLLGGLLSGGGGGGRGSSWGGGGFGRGGGLGGGGGFGGGGFGGFGGGHSGGGHSSGGGRRGGGGRF